MNKKNIQAISLFSGAGGLDLGCKLNNIEVKVSVDNDFDSTETLKLNKEFSKTKILHQDVKNEEPEKLEEYLSNKKTILIGGPPCQPFSKNGYWVTHENRKITKDPRNCISDFFHYVKKLNPDGFLIENVESILHPVNKSAVDNIIQSTKKLDVLLIFEFLWQYIWINQTSFKKSNCRMFSISWNITKMLKTEQFFHM